MISTFAAYVFAALTAAVILFQLALAAGMPWGIFAWGGKFQGRLPSYMRIASVASSLLLLTLGGIVLARAGIALPNWQLSSQTMVWAVVAYCALGVIANAITPSPRERIIWLPVTLILLASSIVVATGR